MILRASILAGLATILVVGPASSRQQEASASTIDWVARACTPDGPFGFRFGDLATGPGYHLLEDHRRPFGRLTLSHTERSRHLFRVETVGMFRAAPRSTQSDPVAGRRLFEALDGRIMELGGFTDRSRVVNDDGDIDITYSIPTSRPDSRVVLEMGLMLGGVWVTCKDQALIDVHVREVLQ